MKNYFPLLLLFTVPSQAGETTLPLPVPDLGGNSAKDIIAAPETNGFWSLRAGIAGRRLGKTTIDPGFRSSGNFASNFFSPNPSSGPEDRDSNRTYDNGFVDLGAATPGTGLTTNWGYANPGQLTNNAIQFTLGGGVALDFPLAGGNKEDTELSPFLELAYVRPFRKDLELGFVSNFFFTNLESDFRSSMNQYSVTTTDRFSLGGILAPLAPYSGTFAGPGPLIPNQPLNRDEERLINGSQTFLFENDTRLFSLGFGTEVLWHPSESCHVSLGTGLVVNIADWQAETSLPLIRPGSTTLENTNFRDSDTEFLWGLYLKLGSGYQINDDWSVEGFFRYDWSEDLEARVGPTSFNVDLSGWSLGLGAGYSF